MEKRPEKISKLNLKRLNLNWEVLNYPSEKDKWKKVDKNNSTIALNVFWAKKEKIYSTFVSKYNPKREKTSYFISIQKLEVWHYIAVKNYQLFKNE